MPEPSGAKAQKVGVISIHPTSKKDPKQNFDHFYQQFGANTGNLMFTTAIFRQIGGTVDHLGFTFDPRKICAEYDAIVIPCANWLNDRTDWTWLCDILDQVDIPVVPIGLGLQSSHSDLDKVRVTPACERLAYVFSRKASQISVRGDFTKAFLNSLGIDNVVTTGCPSIYMRLTDTPTYDPHGGLTILPTRYPISQAFVQSDSLNRNLFAFAARHDLDILFQSEREEMFALFGGNQEALFPKKFPHALRQLYGFETDQALVDYICTRGRSFADLDQWTAYTQTKAGSVGTRLHGTILALNAGCPAALIAHDSRTSEMIEFADIPTAQLSADLSDLDPNNVPATLRPDDYARYTEKRAQNSLIYKAFLRDAGLDYNEAVMF